MRVFLLALACLLSGCASIQNLTDAKCLPAGVPGAVVIKREAYIYQLHDEKEISILKSRYLYCSGADDSGKMIMHYPPPLLVLPPGTQLTIERITRETHFDNSPNAIYVRGVAHGASQDIHFRYLWGISNSIHHAPWETETYDPRDFGRSILCGG